MSESKARINVCLNYWAIGGAENFYHRLADSLPQYEWSFTKKVEPNSDIVVYSNDHSFYKQSKKIGIPAIMRVTGPRSYSLPQPDDLEFVICSSKKSYELSTHSRKKLIYNGINFEHLASIKPIHCQLLVSEARIGVGQKVEKAIKYSIEHKKHLTCLGSRQHLAENTYDQLKSKYPNVTFTGLVKPDVSLQYIKGCEALVIASGTHGISNSLLEATALDKPIINLGGVETVDKKDINIKDTAIEYDNLFKSILASRK